MFLQSFSPIPVVPTDADVLCGRGGLKYFNHPGNRMLRTLTVLKLDDYLQCKRKGEKTAILRSVIHAIFSNDGRFLKFDSTAQIWYDGGLAAAKVRVGVAFRDAKAPNKMRYVEDMKAEIRNMETEVDGRNETIESQSSIRPLPAISSSLPKSHSALVSPDPVSLSNAIMVDSSVAFIPTESSQLSPDLADLNQFEPRSLGSGGDDNDIGIATAQHILATLSNSCCCLGGTSADDDDSCYASSAERESFIASYCHDSGKEIVEDDGDSDDDMSCLDALIGPSSPVDLQMLDDYIIQTLSATRSTDTSSSSAAGVLRLRR